MEHEALEKFSGEGEKHLPTREARVAHSKVGKKYESLTPPWTKSWMGRYLLPFRNKKSGKNRVERSEEIKGEEEKQSRVLGRFRSMFPFMLFPDELIVEEKRVIWRNWMGPGYTRVISIMATDISNVQASHGPFFGHLHVGSLVGGPEILIERLSRKDCVRARALVEGIILAARERAEVKKGKVEKEKEDLSRLGEVKF